jgi:prepilin-type N-terminal cleavage/methylation domain-containing protein/prepilin-type processing-associated H-X9-DG protein
MISRTHRPAFTLVELLVVVAVIGILIGVLLPALSGARDGARTSQATNNVRQIMTAMLTYAADNQLNFPTNVVATPDGRGLRWFDEQRIGVYLAQFDESNLDPDNVLNQTVGGGVFTSPMHPLAGRSFTMNHWAASASVVTGRPNGRLRYHKPGEIPPPYDTSENDRGVGFNASVGRASDTFVIADAWGMYPSQNREFETLKWFTGSQIGQAGLPGERFGGGDNPVNAAAGETTEWTTENLAAPEMAAIRDDVLPTYIPFYRYPSRQLSKPLTRGGSASFGFVDGHVALHTADELVDDKTGRSSYRVLWNPADRRVEEAVLGPR